MFNSIINMLTELVGAALNPTGISVINNRYYEFNGVCYTDGTRYVRVTEKGLEMTTRIDEHLPLNILFNGEVYIASTHNKDRAEYIKV